MKESEGLTEHRHVAVKFDCKLTEEIMEAWRECWRNGFAPALSLQSLEALEIGLALDDSRLIQLALVYAEAPSDRHSLVVAADAIGWCAWQGEGCQTVEEVERFFEETCAKVDQLLGANVYRWFLHWFDDTPRNEMRELLLDEVRNELGRRAFNETEQLKC